MSDFHGDPEMQDLRRMLNGISRDRATRAEQLLMDAQRLRDEEVATARFNRALMAAKFAECLIWMAAESVGESPRSPERVEQIRAALREALAALGEDC